MKSDEILIKTFDQVKNDNFDQVKFDQVIVCHKTLLKVIVTVRVILHVQVHFLISFHFFNFGNKLQFIGNI
jgi:hypothetical protein